MSTNPPPSPGTFDDFARRHDPKGEQLRAWRRQRRLGVWFLVAAMVPLVVWLIYTAPAFALALLVALLWFALLMIGLCLVAQPRPYRGVGCNPPKAEPEKVVRP
jgi:hypothetical protein